MRSWLTTDADNENKLARALQTGTDAVLIDLAGQLADEVAEGAKPAARERAGQWLRDNPPGRTNVPDMPAAKRWVRINGTDTQHWRDDLIAVMPGAPEGIALSDTASPAQVQALAAEIWELEQINAIEYASTRIIPEIGTLPASAMNLAQFLAEPHPRLAGFIWDAQLLADRIGATRTQTKTGSWTATLAFVRAQVLLLASSLRLMAVETSHREFRDEAVMTELARTARADGFTGMAALHPRQIKPINRAFAPTPAECQQARAIVALFESNPSSANVVFERRTLEKSHLVNARNLLAFCRD